MVYQESQGDFKDFDFFEEHRILKDPAGDEVETESEASPTKLPWGRSPSFYEESSFGSPLSP